MATGGLGMPWEAGETIGQSGFDNSNLFFAALRLEDRDQVLRGCRWGCVWAASLPGRPTATSSLRLTKSDSAPSRSHPNVLTSLITSCSLQLWSQVSWGLGLQPVNCGETQTFGASRKSWSQSL